jgi:hypothetical protein
MLVCHDDSSLQAARGPPGLRLRWVYPENFYEK